MSARDPLQDWITWLSERRPDPAPPAGAVSLIDTAARLRAARAVREGVSVSLARAITSQGDGAHGVRVEPISERRGRLNLGLDRVTASAHGITFTHLDALNHYGIDGRFYGDADEATAATDLSVTCWADEGIVTRAVWLDVSAARGADWAGERPVGAADLEAALERAGGLVHPGDALLVDMGRDRFEAAGGAYFRVPERGRRRPGLDRSAAEWIAARRPSAVCWDFLDALADEEGRVPAVHLLIWATGLALIDNCDFAAAREVLGSRGRHDGMLVVAPLALPRATSSLVNPLLVV